MNEREIFEAALELTDPQARQAYLDQACAGNPELRQQVEDLLVLHATAGDFLATPAIEQLSAKTTAVDGEEAQSSADSANAELTLRFTHDSLGRDDEVSLGFLSPSDKSGSLGRLAHYEIHEVLGQGAFGIVLKAFDEKLHRMVAIKVLSPELAKSSPPRKRFLREARSAAAIRHEHVVAIYAVEEQPIPYLVMEYIPGITLEQALTDHGPLDVADVLRLGQQIAAGLAAAHAQSLIHRDIKPSNILLENGLSGRVKISDFGLARTADDASMTQSGTIAGTPLYMSPEQASSGEIDQRSDLFSLGSVLYVMVSGRPPFRAATTLAVLKRVVEDTPRPIPEIIADVPSWLCAIIAKLQAKQPDDRFATASEVADLLGRCLADLQANRPVQLPAGMQINEDKPVETTEPERPLIASDIPLAHTPAPSHSRTTSRRWPTVAAIALIALAGLGFTEATGVTKLTSTVIRLTTGSGTLVIETDDPGVKVTIDGEEVQIQGAGIEQLSLKPGKYQIAAVKNGKPVSQQLVTIIRGGKEVVRVTLEGIARIDTPVIRDPTGSAPTSADPDRAAAEYVLSIGGEIGITENGLSRRIISVVADLPVGAFQLVAVNLIGNHRASDEGLSCFRGCKNVSWLALRDTSLSDAGLEHFQNCKDFAFLRLSGMPSITDAGLAYFDGCKKLQFLELDSNPQITGLGLATFQECKDLETLHINVTSATDSDVSLFKKCHKLIVVGCAGTKMTNAGLMALIQDHKNLVNLDFRGTGFADQDLDSLAECSQLLAVALNGTKVTAAGVKKLAAALPKCQITWDGGVIEPTSADPDRAAAEYVLSIGGEVKIKENGEERDIKEVSDLPVGAFDLSYVELSQNPKVTDTGLANFSGCTKIEHLKLYYDSLTDAGLIHFQNCKSLTYLNLAANPVTDAGLVHFNGLKHLRVLLLGNTKVSDAGLANFQDSKNLTQLWLDGAPVKDAGLAYFKDCHNLETLGLMNTQVTDAGLDQLKEYKSLAYLLLAGTQVTDAWLEKLAGFPKLTRVHLAKTKVTEAGVKKLAAALSKCRIEWDGRVIEPTSADGWHGWSADAPPPAIAPFDAEQAKKHQEEWAAYLKVPVEYTNSIGMKFRLIPPGEFLMGSTPEEIEAAIKDVSPDDKHWQECIRSEAPQHKVVLTQPIYLGVNEVTQSEYEKVMGQNPSHFAATGAGKEIVAGMDTTSHPVENVSWNDAAEFCAKLSQQESLKPFYFLTGETIRPLDGTGYRLSSEAEWEFACRAGTATKYWIGDKNEDLVRAGWSGGNSGGRTHAVSELKANPYGLSDIHGNVWEWVQDGWEPTYYGRFQEKPAINPISPFSAGSERVIRGGDWWGPASNWRSSSRSASDPSFRDWRNGFRVALPVDAVKQALPRTPMAANPDRAAAEWVLSIGGAIKIREHGEEREIKAASDLPAGALELTVVELDNNLKATDAGVAVFQDCRNLRVLNLGRVPVTDAGFAYFQNCTNLETLGLSFMSVSNDSLAHFRSCNRLRHLRLFSTNCSDAGLAHFRDCNDLRELGLENSYGITDAGLAHFQGCKELRILHLTGTHAVTDVGLANFQDCKNLTVLQLEQTQVTDAGLAYFERCKNLETLYLSNTRVTDAGLAHFLDCQKLMHLLLDATQVTDAGLVHLKNWPKLGMLTLGNTAVSDAGLVDLVRLSNLNGVGLRNTRVSLSGYEQLKVARPDFRLNESSWSETNRTIAESVLALGGTVEIGTPGEPESRPVVNVAELPAEYFQVRRVSLAGVEQPLENLPELLSWLKYPQFDQLERLDLSGIAGLTYGFLKPIHGLRELNLARAGLTDVSLAQLPQLPTLKRLVLDGNDLRGPGLASLKEQPELIDLSLQKTKVTAAKIDELKQSLPKCRITWDGGVIEP